MSIAEYPPNTALERTADKVWDLRVSVEFAESQFGGRSAFVRSATKMKRDITVSISLWILAGLWIAAVATGIGQLSYGSDAPLWFYVVFGLFILSLLRAVILFFQTLIDSIRPRDRQNARIGWAVLHFFLGFIASYLYYYIHKPGRAERIRQKIADSEEDLKRRANEGSL